MKLRLLISFFFLLFACNNEDTGWFEHTNVSAISMNFESNNKRIVWPIVKQNRITKDFIEKDKQDGVYVDKYKFSKCSSSCYNDPPKIEYSIINKDTLNLKVGFMLVCGESSTNGIEAEMRKDTLLLSFWPVELAACDCYYFVTTKIIGVVKAPRFLKIERRGPNYILKLSNTIKK